MSASPLRLLVLSSPRQHERKRGRRFIRARPRQRYSLLDPKRLAVPLGVPLVGVALIYVAV
jgi:hypothetical protein